MMREHSPLWVKRTDTVNFATVATLLLFILWATVFR